jgi:hypothetical protein
VLRRRGLVVNYWWTSAHSLKCRRIYRIYLFRVYACTNVQSFRDYSVVFSPEASRCIITWSFRHGSIYFQNLNSLVLIQVLVHRGCFISVYSMSNYQHLSIKYLFFPPVSFKHVDDMTSFIMTQQWHTKPSIDVCCSFVQSIFLITINDV